MIQSIKHAYRTYKNRTRDKSYKQERSSQWHVVEKKHLEKHSKCEACGSTKNLNVHHIMPFHLFPEKELDPENLITLCMDKERHCHLLFGHGGYFSAFVDSVQSIASSAITAYLNGNKNEISKLITLAKSIRRLK